MINEQEAIKVMARAIRDIDGCGLTLKGENVFCDDTKLKSEKDCYGEMLYHKTCECKEAAKAANTASPYKKFYDDMQWRSMDSAPKDGRRILVSIPTPYIYIAKWTGIMWTYDSPWLCAKEPTHWMPLPAPSGGEDGRTK